MSEKVNQKVETASVNKEEEWWKYAADVLHSLLVTLSIYIVLHPCYIWHDCALTPTMLYSYRPRLRTMTSGLCIPPLAVHVHQLGRSILVS